MQPQDVMFLTVTVFALGIIVVGASLVEVSFLFWFGIVLLAGLGALWIVNRRHRHGSHY